MAKDMKTPKDVPPDTLTQQIGVLTRREVEARILSPIIDALGERFGRDEVIELIWETIIEIAHRLTAASRVERKMDEESPAPCKKRRDFFFLGWF